MLRMCATASTMPRAQALSCWIDQAVGLGQLLSQQQLSPDRPCTCPQLIAWHGVQVVLHEYLSYNWHNLEDVYEANRHLLGEDGLFCTWSKSLEV